MLRTKTFNERGCSSMKAYSFLTLLFLFIFVSSASAEKNKKWYEKLIDLIDYRLEYQFEYNDNVFLTPNNEEDDVIHRVNQEIEFEHSGEDLYTNVLFRNRLPYYQDQDELIPSYLVEARASYTGIENLSLGVSNIFQKVDETDVARGGGDQVLSLGYIYNQLQTGAQYDINDRNSVEINWAFDTFDYDRSSVDFFIDRDVHDIEARWNFQWATPLETYLGYRFRDVAFDQFSNKDSESNLLFTGFKTYCLPGVTLYGEVGYEDREFINNRDTVGTFLGVPIMGTSRRDHENVNYRIGIETNLSRYNRIYAYFDNRLYESSRSEFTHYEGKTVGAGLRHFLSKKTILFFDFYAQRQEFDSKDNVISLFGGGNAETDFYTYSTTLRRLINKKISCDVNYIYSQRNTDFLGEDNENHRFLFGVKAYF